LAAAPISWGVCEIPGWGLQLPPERVLSEMAALGLTATELGPQGWLPREGAAVRAELDRHPLVDRHESESADGATVAHLSG
jgi:inosose dehydratase